MYKFDINENGYCSGYSKNGTVPMSDEYNLNNIPTSFHKHVEGSWILDKDLQIALLTQEVLDRRKQAYDLGLQVGALMKQVNYDRLQGKELIQELDDALGHVQSVKHKYPKEEV